MTKNNKAVSFMEYVSSLELTRTNIEKKCEVLESIDSALIFYSTPFCPELIEKCFEGWEEDENDRDYFNMEDAKELWEIKTQVFGDSKTLQITLDHYNKKMICSCDTQATFPVCEVETIETENNFPSTLDSFITDCQRAGIDLTFSPLLTIAIKLKIKKMKEKIEEILIANYYYDDGEAVLDHSTTIAELLSLFEAEKKKLLEPIKAYCEKTKKDYEDDSYLDQWNQGVHFGKTDVADDILKLIPQDLLNQNKAK